MNFANASAIAKRLNQFIAGQDSLKDNWGVAVRKAGDDANKLNVHIVFKDSEKTGLAYMEKKLSDLPSVLKEEATNVYAEILGQGLVEDRNVFVKSSSPHMFAGLLSQAI